jgi:ribonuclease HI
MTDWIYKWSGNGWISSRGEPVVNQDLIREALGLDDDVAREGRVRYTWIPRERNQPADEKCNSCLDEQGDSSDKYW